MSGYRWLHGEGGWRRAWWRRRGFRRRSAARWDDGRQVEAIVQALRAADAAGRRLDPETLYAAMSTDKKWQGGHSRFVLLEGFGKPTIVRDVPRATVIEVLQAPCNNV